ncbi:CoxG family protein [Methyloferula stellata]|uniref:CoxG family protein n=1 Tax=Methyloferula stellata TaxID=876270 RepID=UPI0003622CF0|nr:carbon monoxide dehydrogenase subunit G [Methyloferula stellata]
MELEGRHEISAPRQLVWAALNDPDALRACIPGCKELTKTADNAFTARVVSKIGPVSASFSGTVELSDIDPGRAYTITGTGQGGVAGFAKGSARVALADQAQDVTLLTYTAKADIGGKLASVGSRMLEGTARKTADEFFTAIAAHLSGGIAKTDPASIAPDAPIALPQPSQPAAAFPQTIKVEFGELKIVTKTPWTIFGMTFAAISGWLAAAALAWRLYH